MRRWAQASQRSTCPPILGGGLVGRPTQKIGKPFDVADIMELGLGAERRIVMSSISRRRNGLMALSVIGGSCLEGGSRPLISRQDARFGYFTGRHQLPRERFSPSALNCRGCRTR
jgi:hypothetical protein